jgi:hypothetical protein
MKPQTIKENGIINLLKDGEIITSCLTEFFGKKGQVIYSARWYRINGKRIHPSTILAMIRRNVIHGPSNDKSICYSLKQI